MSPWLLLLLVVIVAALALAVAPLLGARRLWEDAEASELDRLFDEKSRTLRAIKDIDHERDAALLSEDDWREARGRHLDEAVRLNREITARTGVDPAEIGAAA